MELLTMHGAQTQPLPSLGPERAPALCSPLGRSVPHSCGGRRRRERQHFPSPLLAARQVWQWLMPITVGCQSHWPRLGIPRAVLAPGHLDLLLLRTPLGSLALLMELPRVCVGPGQLWLTRLAPVSSPVSLRIF